MFAQDKGRFALQNGVETYPPTGASVGQCEPRDMSIKDLKAAIARAGLVAQTVGFSEKREYIDLLVAHQNK